MMKTKNLLAVLILAMAGLSTMNAQEMDHSKMKKDTTKMEMYSKRAEMEIKHETMKIDGMYTCPMHSDVKSDKPGTCPKCGMELKKMEMKKDSMKMNMDHSKMKMMDMKMDHSKMEMANTYVCPMHPAIKSDKPDACPKCGMVLQPTKTAQKQ